MFWIGVDGGGTKTLLRMDTDGELKEFRSGSININGVGEKTAEENLKHLLTEAKSAAHGKQPDGVCIGTAGYSNARQRELVYETVLQEGIPADHLYLTDDGEIALQGALEEKNGLILISGTGSICYGRSADQKVVRTGGYGHILDDGGSGYAVGREILSTVIRYLDGRGTEAPVLTALTAQKLNADTKSVQELPQVIVSYVYSPRRSKADIASFAELLEPAVHEGDYAATQIANSAALELMDLITAGTKKMQSHGTEEDVIPICFLGGFITHTECIRTALTNMLSENANGVQYRVQEPLHDAAGGALLLAKKVRAIQI